VASLDESGYFHWSMFITESIRYVRSVSGLLDFLGFALVGVGGRLYHLEPHVARHFSNVGVAQLGRQHIE